MALLFLLGSGCDDGALGPDRTFDIAINERDFSGVGSVDLARPASDLGSSSGCTEIATWTSDQGTTSQNDSPSASPGSSWDDFIYGVRSADDREDALVYQFFQPQTASGPVAVPHAFDFSRTDELLWVELDLSGSPTYFVATSGDVTVTAVDDTQPSGNIAVHGTDIVFRQTTDDDDTLVAGGACVLVGSFDLSGEYQAE